MMRVLKWTGLGLLVLVAGAAIYFYDPLPAHPPAEALSANAEKYDVEIHRDRWGVPHIFGKSDADTAFGVAYAHAEDDYETIQEVVAATRGTLANYRGMGAAPTDYLVGFLDVWETVDRRYDSDVPADVKAIAEAYADGLNLYAAQHPGETWKGLAPFRGEDVVAGYIFKTPLFYGLDETILGLMEDERAVEVALDPSGDRKAWHIAPATMTERGSNAFAVAPHRSGDGTTRLLINSHQPMTGPVAWWEAHTVSEEGLDMTGGLFPGTPIIIHGFNRTLGWANTVNKPDLADVYRLTINPDDKNQYQLDGEWRDFEHQSVKIKVRLWGPFALTATRKILRSEHGPVIEADHGTYAVRYAGRGEIRQLEQYYRLNKAENFEAFKSAMAMNALPSINYVYADKDGNIAFYHNAQYPDRKSGWNWQQDLPGERSDLIWQSYLPFEEIPALINPPSGFVFNTNNTPFDATDGAGDLRASDFPSTMGLETHQTNRALRINELIQDPSQPIDRGKLLSIKFDTRYASRSAAAGVVADVLAANWDHDAQLSEAAKHLAAWDMGLDADSRHAALGGLTVMPKVTENLTGIDAPDSAQAFEDAVAYLHKHHGRIDPLWGDINVLSRGSVQLPVDGGPDTLRAIYPAEFGEDGMLQAAAGDTWIALVEWDGDGNVSADVIHQFGSATLDETSPHYSDQAALFAKKKWRRAALDKEEIRKNAVRSYTPLNK